MSGYNVNLYKYMRIDNNLDKKAQLLDTRKNIVEHTAENKHKFLVFGEFDSVSFDRVERFSRFRDVSPDARTWIGDRQIHLIFDLERVDGQDDIVYEDGVFYELNGKVKEQSCRLFIGLTVLQFKHTEKKKCGDMREYLRTCKSQIIEKKLNSGLDVKCAVFGTLGSFGLTIIWLADQYVDVLNLVTTIREEVVVIEPTETQSIFLSSNTIFAKNHQGGDPKQWEDKICSIKGDSFLRLTLKRGLREDIREQLNRWKKSGTELYHCAGEHDVSIMMESNRIYSFFDKGMPLHFDEEFFNKEVLQSYVHLCENDILCRSSAVVKGPPEEGRGQEESEEYKIVISELDEIQKEYMALRTKFANLFPSATGMVDTLDLLYSDYISKISIASNEMWVNNYTHQFLRVLSCLNEFCGNIEKLDITKEQILKIMNELLSDFERQISHIAESNNLTLGTPVCQYRYSGQNNLTLFAYFGIIKSLLDYIYRMQDVNMQDEIVPLIVADIVPIIQSNLYIEYCGIPMEKRNDAKIVTINLPMVALYNPVGYYPYLYHEIYHYIVPTDRYTRNKLLGCLVSINILYSIVKKIMYHDLVMEPGKAQQMLNLLLESIILRYIYSFVIDNYEKYIGIDVEFLPDCELTKEEVDQIILPSVGYVRKLSLQWTRWLNSDRNVSVSKNPVYECIKDLYENQEDILEFVRLWIDGKKEEGEGELAFVCGAVDTFIEKLGGIADNNESNALQMNYNTLLESLLDDSVFDHANQFVNAAKEMMADTAMIEICEMGFSEYLIMFTKTKKDLLINSNRESSLQDIIRVGTALRYICRGRVPDGRYEGYVKSQKDNFLNLYCGLYYSKHKDSGPEYSEELTCEANGWFSYWYNCFNIYSAKYRIYEMLFSKLQSCLLLSSKENSGYHNSTYWKKYVDALMEFGIQFRQVWQGNSTEQHIEYCKSIDKRIFQTNMELIFSFQHQDELIRLDEFRRTCYHKGPYRKSGLEDIDKQENFADIFGVKPHPKKKNYFWEYTVDSVEQLSSLTARIAAQLKRVSWKYLEEKDIPIWYRGHQSSDYKLIPSIMRKYKDQKEKQKSRKNNYSLAQFLRSEYEEFKFRADGAFEAIDRTGYTDSDYLALMQHYSVPSNFLDWTEDALSALYFSLECFFDPKVEDPKKDAVLYVFSPELYNYARQKMLLATCAEDDRMSSIEEEIAENTAHREIPNLSVDYNTDGYRTYLLGSKDYDGNNRKPYSNEVEAR